MRIHLIAIGGSVMHNLALALQKIGHRVSGSDDHIYDPARSRLAAAGLLPDEDGWAPARIDPSLDLVILGMHARKENPELARARELGLRIVSFPEFIYEHSRDKKRVVVAGSHGKTTTTAMLMHILREGGYDFDYLVGAQLEGFDHMVRLSEAPLIVLEGDEYLSSPLDPVPKIFHYQPHLTAITGIAWDHMNVFPTEANYQEQFEKYLTRLAPGAQVFYFAGDEALARITSGASAEVTVVPYRGFEARQRGDGHFVLETPFGELVPRVFGAHNFQNLEAAARLAQALEVPGEVIARGIESFSGASKRLQALFPEDSLEVYQDFAHAPSKVRATTEAVKSRFPYRRLTACLELHTFSSLNRQFLPQYAGTLNAADRAYVLFNPETLKQKRMPALSRQEVASFFDHPGLEVFDDVGALQNRLAGSTWSTEKDVLLWMSSGPWGGLNLKEVSRRLYE